MNESEEKLALDTRREEEDRMAARLAEIEAKAAAEEAEAKLAPPPADDEEMLFHDDEPVLPEPEPGQQFILFRHILIGPSEVAVPAGLFDSPREAELAGKKAEAELASIIEAELVAVDARGRGRKLGLRGANLMTLVGVRGWKHSIHPFNKASPIARPPKR